MATDKQPKNVQAIIDWVKQHRPDCLATVEQLFATNNPHSPTEAIIALTLMGFEAGRVFQKKNPKVVSGTGYAS